MLQKPSETTLSPVTAATLNMAALPLLFLLPLLSLTSNALVVQSNLNLGLKNTVVITGNSTVVSKNRKFELAFFSPDRELSWYLGIRFGSIPGPTYVWVANRETPISNLTSCTLGITTEGRLAVLDESRDSIIWQTLNREKAVSVRLRDTGNLVLLSMTGSVVWQSFDCPADTWLPAMNITGAKKLRSWRSLSNPSPGLYSLRLNPRDYNEFELVYNESLVYWKTGNWTGKSFTNVPEMTVPYIYGFHFVDPYTSSASFWYTEKALDGSSRPPLTRIQLDVNGQLKQFTWSQQTENWNMFWSQPDNLCKVYGLCGNFGVCQNNLLKPCVCLSGFNPVNNRDWQTGGYSGGCGRGTGDSSEEENEEDVFMEVGIVGFDGATTVSFSGSRSVCEKSCLGNRSCIGLFHDDRSNTCKNLYGSLLNLRNLSSDSTFRDILYVRVSKQEVKKDRSRHLVLALVGGIVFSTLFSVLAVGTGVLILLKRRKNSKSMQEDGGFPLLNLKAFSYKELCAATRGFSDKLGHGGFGAVFRGVLMDSTPVAVKRLERPGSGEKEFRAEVCTIGNIQHVNLVRLRGFCSENSHRLLVYDYMSNGPLSVYLLRDGPNLSWDVRFRVAIGTARGIAYLHEECRDCIIHCDIKPENILLDSDYTAKVSDFGLAKLVDRDFSRVLATMQGTWGYVAPEWISGVAITTKADVYSYGMTLLELLGGRRNVEAPPSAGGANGGREHENEENWFLPPYAAQQILEGNIAAVVDDRLGSAYNIEEAERVALVAIWCIQDTEEMRPAMGTVVKMLEGVVELNTPPPPKLLQALISGESYRGIQTDSSNRNHVSRHINCSESTSPSNPCSPINDNMDLR